MKITLSDNKYTFLIGYQKDSHLRTELNELAKKIFGISFEDWYQAGYWNEKYIPYTLFSGKHAVANVSVNIMDFNIFGEQKRCIQIGTVMTDENYRNKSLSRFLIEKVLNDWTPKCDFIYLYANSSVLGLYPKFGFSRVKEYSFFKPVQSDNSANIEKLNMAIQENRDLLYDYAKNTEVFGKLSMKENADLVMFYCTSFLKESIYYIQPLDVIVVATFNDKQLHLLDVFAKVKVPLDKIIDYLSNAQINEILLGFTPEYSSQYQVKEISTDDFLFVQNNNTSIFENNKVMFPLLSHA